MTTRLRLVRAQRLLRVQEQMRGIAERDLAANRAQAAKVEADRAAMLATLAGETMHGLFLDAAARRLRALAAEATELGATSTRLSEILRARGLAEKRAERQADGLLKLREREREQRALLEQLDLMAARGAHPPD
ncbi:hypothetical protein ASF49_14685 [Methylobacterium sp. Leaf104]|uniref:hypothetical protein n=1 Tax=Methylobacterium TaxID=407 RepID=UPI0006FB6D44|nr:MULTISPECIES: hypothetical protein [Methylobacterium]KQP29922.1 hypothetical protein ASF49_14685 [Methylobacterium sp. Leaf104]MCI9882384.1 hypothetical protein [Methylobacterium goesingense]